jgi:hypothetical protein
VAIGNCAIVDRTEIALCQFARWLRAKPLCWAAVGENQSVALRGLQGWLHHLGLLGNVIDSPLDQRPWPDREWLGKIASILGIIQSEFS